MSFTPDSERLVVRFLSAALGQGRETARAFCQRLPENVQPRLLALAQNWNQRACLDASTQFSSLMAPNVSPLPALQVLPPQGKPQPVGKPRKQVVWTPEMRAAQSKKVKRIMAAKKRAAKVQQQATSQPQPVAVAADKSTTAAQF